MSVILILASLPTSAIMSEVNGYMIRARPSCPNAVLIFSCETVFKKDLFLLVYICYLVNLCVIVEIMLVDPSSTTTNP